MSTELEGMAAIDEAGDPELTSERARRMADAAVHQERRRLALELHDTVGAMLFTIGAGARKLAEDADVPPDLRDRLVGISLQASEAVDTLRRSLRALYTPAEELSLAVAISSDCRAFEERAEVRTGVIHLTDVPALCAARSRALADAVREALLNVEKHADAASVVVTVAARQGHVTVSVVDDGVGLADGGSGDGSGLGLVAAAERLARLGGGLRLEGNDDGGATLRAWVPA